MNRRDFLETQAQALLELGETIKNGYAEEVVGEEEEETGEEEEEAGEEEEEVEEGEYVPGEKSEKKVKEEREEKDC